MRWVMRWGSDSDSQIEGPSQGQSKGQGSTCAAVDMEVMAKSKPYQKEEHVTWIAEFGTGSGLGTGITRSVNSSKLVGASSTFSEISKHGGWGIVLPRPSLYRGTVYG